MLLGVGALIIVILLLFLFIPRKTEAPSDQIGNATDTATAGEVVQDTLAGLIGMGKNVQCSFSYEQDGVNSQGVIYISGKKMRGEFVSAIQGANQDTSMIQNGEYSYIWGSAMPKGIKMKASGSAGDTVDTESKKYFDPDKALDYSCKPWSVDDGMFTPPADVTFEDLSAMMESLPGANTGVATGMPDLKNAQCAACDNLSGDAAAQCKSALNCN